MKDINILKTLATHQKLEHTNAIRMDLDWLNTLTMSMISSKINALKMSKRNKRNAIITVEMLFIEVTVDSPMNLMMVTLEIITQTADKIDNTIESISKEDMDMDMVIDIQTIESMLINLVFKRTTNKVAKSNNQLKIMNKKILTNLCNRKNNLCNKKISRCQRNNPQFKRKQLVKLITLNNILRLQKTMRK
jgi:hypothetical protein